MSSKIVKFDKDVYEEIKLGVDILARAVRTTMGPKGKTVLIERPGQHPLVTKDGVTVAKHLNLSDQFQNLGVQVIKEAAQRSADEAGDGTTTATVLAHAILEKGLQMIAAGKDAVKIRKCIETATNQVIQVLRDQSCQIKSDKELKQIAMISCNGEEEIANLIVESIKSVGVDGSIMVENAKGYTSDLTVVEGIQLNRGYMSPYFINDQDKMTCSFEKCLVLLVAKKVESLKELLKPLEHALTSEKQILIIADDIEDEVLQGLVVNKTKGNLKVCVIKSPGFGSHKRDMMIDLSAITGASIFDNTKDIKEFDEEDLGTVKRCIVSRNSCLFLADGDRQEYITKRIERIKMQLETEMLEESDITALNFRLSQLSGGIALLRVGASTEAEMLERRDRVDDALSATRAALQEGIVAGGGVAIASASLSIEASTPEEQLGVDILKYACFAPIMQIVKNTGKSADLVIEKIHESGKKDYGYDARNENFGNMFDLGVIDPVKVVRCALQNASSAASLLLTSECAMIYENKNVQE